MATEREGIGVDRLRCLLSFLANEPYEPREEPWDQMDLDPDPLDLPDSIDVDDGARNRENEESSVELR